MLSRCRLGRNKRSVKVSELEKEKEFYKNNPGKYAELVKQISGLKTTDKEKYLKAKRELIKGVNNAR